MSFGLKALMGFAIVAVVLGMLLTVGAQMQQDFRDDQSAGTIAYTIANDSLTNTSTINSKVPTIITVVVSVLLIGIVIGAFGKLMN